MTLACYILPKDRFRVVREFAIYKHVKKGGNIYFKPIQTRPLGEKMLICVFFENTLIQSFAISSLLQALLRVL